MRNVQKYSFINLLLNGVIVNNVTFELDKLEIESLGFSYNWGEDFLTQYNKIDVLDKFRANQIENVFIYNNILKKFATKVHIYNKEHILEVIKNFKQYTIQNIDIIRNLNKFLPELNTPLVVIIMNFNGLKIIQATPENFGTKIKWVFKEVNITFESYNLFASKIFKKLESFLSQKLSLSEIYNIMYNFINFPVLQSTNIQMLDILRSIVLELLVESLEHTDIPNFNNGLLVVTGELISLFGRKEHAYLSLIDGLLLNGIWGVLFDTNNIFFNILYLLQNKNLTQANGYFNILFPFLDVFYLSWVEDVPILEVGYTSGKKFIGSVNHLIKYAYNKKANIFYSKNALSNGTNQTNSYYELVLPKAVPINSIIIDNRQRPITYGPGPLANKSRISSNIADLMEHES